MKKDFYPHWPKIHDEKPEMLKRPEGVSQDDVDRAFGIATVVGTPRVPRPRNHLFFAHTTGVNPEEAKAAWEGIKKFMAEVHSKIQTHNQSAFNDDEGPHGSSDWYQNQATVGTNKGCGPQISCYEADVLLRKSPRQKALPHFDVMVFDRDLTTADGEDEGYVYGYTKYPNNVLSGKRLRTEIKDPSVRSMALHVLAAHELGHNFHLVGRDFKKANRMGPHCDGSEGPCLMEQVEMDGCKGIEEQTRLLIDREHLLCTTCAQEAAFRREDLEARGIVW